MCDMKLKEFKEELNKYPDDSDVLVYVYDEGDVFLYAPEIEGYQYSKRIIISPDYDKCEE